MKCFVFDGGFKESGVFKNIVFEINTKAELSRIRTDCLVAKREVIRIADKHRAARDAYRAARDAYKAVRDAHKAGQDQLLEKYLVARDSYKAAGNAYKAAIDAYKYLRGAEKSAQLPGWELVSN